MKMMTLDKMKEKIFMAIALTGLALGNMAINGICYFGIYEAEKPDILKDEK